MRGKPTNNKIAQKPSKKVPTFQKNFKMQCQICLQDFDEEKHVPMIICANFHTMCLKCVNQNLFKKQMNANNQHTGKYLCSQCSELVEKESVYQHQRLMEINQKLKKIKERDQKLRKQFYHQIGCMGMNLISQRQDMALVKKDNQRLKEQNGKLLDQIYEMKQRLKKLESIQALESKVKEQSQKLESIQCEVNFKKATLESIQDQIKYQNCILQLLKSEQSAIRDESDAFKLKMANAENQNKRIEGDSQEHGKEIKRLSDQIQRLIAELSKCKYELLTKQPLKGKRKKANIINDNSEQNRQQSSQHQRHEQEEQEPHLKSEVEDKSDKRKQKKQQEQERQQEQKKQQEEQQWQTESEDQSSDFNQNQKENSPIEKEQKQQAPNILQDQLIQDKITN